MTDWKETTLWKHLAAAPGPEAEAARALLVQEMPRIQTILTQAHTAPTDFTLHDADHSFRVAKWMAGIIPGDVLEKLSPYEITLLLLSAYLHDIGMTPEQGRVDRFWSHLVYGTPDPKSPRQPLTEEEARDLQGWLDDEGRDLTIPLAPDGTASEETKRLADLLIAHYCRHKHNDWSGEWIKANLRRDALLGYEAWVDDLVQLCHSHHEGYDELKQSRFDPRPAGPSGQPVHHRYLACVLRVADVLEIDPERTPEVIFRHREIHPGSVLYWRKDHENWIIRGDNSLVLTASPESAVLENAIRKTADGIQQELLLCARLNREQPFFYWQLRPHQQLQHRWDFPEVLTVHVQPRNDAYVYIDGAFRPNTEKLLELLSGTQLYGDPLVAVRELLQNAFDAVKEEMAYQRLERPKDPEFAKHLAAMHRVELRVEERDGRKWLVCKDTGVGMTRRIIEEYLLVSGNSRRREIVELERRCRDAGFRFGRTGQFGIGVLSYFMLADRVEIRTRRSTARADAEAIGWSFVTDGVGAFGELKKEPSVSSGTEVRFRLREGLKWEEVFDRELNKYIKETVRYIPCNLELHELGEDGESLSWEAGWVHSLEERSALLWPDDLWQRMDLLPAAKRDFARSWWQAAQVALRWRVEQGELPDNLGTYRISIPWFELPGGPCEAFMLVQSAAQGRVIKPLEVYDFEPIGFVPPGMLLESIHGMSLEDNRDDFFWDKKGVGVLEIDWENSEAGLLRVDRSSLEASTVAAHAEKWVGTRSLEILAEVLMEKPSEYAFLSENWLEGLRADPHWVVGNRGKTQGFFWRPITFPVTVVQGPGNQEESLSFGGEDLRVLSWGTFLTDRGSYRNIKPFQARCPDKLVVRSSRPLSLEVFCLWESAQECNRRCALGMISKLPPDWKKICGVGLDQYGTTVWNVDHPIASRVDEPSAQWFQEIQELRATLDILALEGEDFTSPGRLVRVLAWVLAETKTEDMWKVLLERNPSLAERLLYATLGSREGEEAEEFISFLRQNYEKPELIVLTASSVTIAKPGDPLFEEFLPDPGPDWAITEAPSDDAPT